jgi:hypothetical protein
MACLADIKCKLLLVDATGQHIRQVAVPARDAIRRAGLVLDSDPSVSIVEIWSVRNGNLGRLILRLERTAES